MELAAARWHLLLQDPLGYCPRKLSCSVRINLVERMYDADTDNSFRIETIGLHVAQTYPGAQFYIGCAQINVTGGGSASPATVSFPGAYHGSDPGITLNIYYPVRKGLILLTRMLIYDFSGANLLHFPRTPSLLRMIARHGDLITKNLHYVCLLYTIYPSVIC